MSGDWSRYWRSADEPLEAMHAHFREHVYHRHSHDTYSFGVTDSGAQSFTCRDAAHTSAAGMVMAFNPDDPHDGRATTGQGFSYRMIHIGPELVADVLADIGGRPAGGRVRHAGPAGPRARRGAAAAARRADRPRHPAGAGRAADHRAGPGGPGGGTAARPGRIGAAETMRIARRVRDLLDANYAGPVSGADLAAAAGCSRFAAYRAFRRGRAGTGRIPASARLRAARRELARGAPPGRRQPTRASPTRPT